MSSCFSLLHEYGPYILQGIGAMTAAIAVFLGFVHLMTRPNRQKEIEEAKRQARIEVIEEIKRNSGRPPMPQPRGQ